MQGLIPQQMDWLVYAGKGSRTLSIGLDVTETESLLGRPDSVVADFKGHYYFLYHKLGLQIDFGARQGSAQALFFYRGAVESYSQSPAETIEGLAPGVLKQRVLEALGPPDKCGGGNETGGVREWFWYKQGIQFDFNQQNVADIMTIFNPERDFADQLL